MNPEIERDSIGVYVISNTPGFLYRQLRRLESTQRLADLSVDQLSHQYAQLIAQTPRTIREVALAYAHIAAMTLRDPLEWIPVLATMDVAPLQWGERFRQLAKQSGTPSQLTSIVYRAPDNDLWPVTAVGSTTSSLAIPAHAELRFSK